MEMWPRGDKSKAKLLHEGVIYNDGTGDKNNGNYSGFLSRRGGFGKKSDLPQKVLTSVWRSGAIEGFKRLSYGAWNLLARMLWESNV